MANSLLNNPNRRMRKAYWTAFKVAMSYLSLYLRSRIFGQRYYDRRILACHKKNAQRVKKAVLALQGLFIKVGQLLSILSNFLPEAFQKPLEELQDQVPARPVAEVKARITKELGQSTAQLFATFSDQPLAAASIGQAHRAQLMDGTEVVVKVQHQHIEAVASVDLEIINRIQKIVAWWFGVKGIDHLYTQVRQMIEEELNFEMEAASMQTIASHFTTEPQLIIPKVHEAFSSRRILTTTWCTGVKINQTSQLAEWDLDGEEIAARLTRIYCQMVFKDGHYHADPHPGNILVQEDGTIVLLDFGAVAQLPSAMRQGISQLIEAAVKNDVQTIIKICADIGFIAPGPEAEKMAERIINALRTFIQKEIKLENLDFKNIEIDPFNNSLFELIQSIGISGVTNTIQVPKEWVLLNRMATLLMGICNTLDPQFNPLLVVRPYVQEFVLGKKGDPVSLISRLIRDTATGLLSLPGELNTVLQQTRQGRIAIETPTTAYGAKLIYHSIRQLVFAALLIGTSFLTFLFFTFFEEPFFKFGIGLCIFWLLCLWRAFRKGKQMRLNS